MAGGTRRTAAAVLSVAQMYLADRITMEGGTSGKILMANAGSAIAEQIAARWSPRPCVVLCGPGNNGGDGFVVARLLSLKGWPVQLALLGERAELKGDAAHHARLWKGNTLAMEPACLKGAELVVDALFGAGLARPLSGRAAKTVRQANGLNVPIVAVDVPSGLLGDSGQVLGEDAIEAALTVTFCRKKPAHLLQPGASLCGEVVVADIGIADDTVESIAVNLWENSPDFWGDGFPWRGADSHKYRHGHALVAGGEVMTGAARLAGLAALRAGSGLVTISAPASAVPVYQMASPSLIVFPMKSPDDFGRLLADDRCTAALIGPGAGVSSSTKAMALASIEAGKATVLDADALTLFADDHSRLASAVKDKKVVLTPHEGEFKRLFPDLKGHRLARARAAAKRIGAVVVLKGADTVVASPDERATVNAHAAPELATAGSGDVLAGIITGLLAQGMSCLEAASAGVWLQGDAACRVGPGLISEDLVRLLPDCLSDLYDRLHESHLKQ